MEKIMEAGVASGEELLGDSRMLIGIVSVQKASHDALQNAVLEQIIVSEKPVGVSKFDVKVVTAKNLANGRGRNLSRFWFLFRPTYLPASAA
jgi:hypothetical protein